MGITGLLPFLEKASRTAHLKEFRGCTAAVDTYCWLHRGAFGCAEKLVKGEDTDGYVQYCVKNIKLLQSFGIRPIMVFDGQHLPAKSSEEAKRRKLRQHSKQKAIEMLRLGDLEQARSLMRVSVDITHKMAFKLIRECRRMGVDCIVAPYEADAQLAFLNINKMVHFVITEDSDLVLFGCDKVFFKMNSSGMGTLVESDKISICMKLRPDNYSFEKFRHMCILSGCDYLENLPGIGLKKALKFVSLTANPDIYQILTKLPSYLKLSNLVVTDNYREAFMVADATFKHQLVFDPVLRKLKPLNEPSSWGTNPEHCKNAGKLFDNEDAFQLALGNIDPFTNEVLDTWSPDSTIMSSKSIWSPQYQKPTNPLEKTPILNAPNTKESCTIVKVTADEIDCDTKLFAELERYRIVEQPGKKQKIEERPASPVLSTTVVPFKKKLSKFQHTRIQSTTLETLGSRFFAFNESSTSKCCDTSLRETKDDKVVIVEKETENAKNLPKDNGEFIEEKSREEPNSVNNEETLVVEKCNSDSESILCEPDVSPFMKCWDSGSSNSSPRIIKDTILESEIEKELKSLEIVQLKDITDANNKMPSSPFETDTNIKSCSRFFVGHSVLDPSYEETEEEKRREHSKPRVKRTPIRRLGLPPPKNKEPKKKQLTLLDMFGGGLKKI